MQPVQACHLGTYYRPAPGGIETPVRTRARAQADLGARVRVFCVNHEGGPTAVEHDGPVEVTRFGRVGSALKLDFCPELVRGLRRVEADILHLQVPNPTMILALLAARPKIPLVVAYQSDVINQSSAPRRSGRWSGWPAAASARSCRPARPPRAGRRSSPPP